MDSFTTSCSFATIAVDDFEVHGFAVTVASSVLLKSLAQMSESALKKFTEAGAQALRGTQSQSKTEIVEHTRAKRCSTARTTHLNHITRLSNLKYQPQLPPTMYQMNQKRTGRLRQTNEPDV